MDLQTTQEFNAEQLNTIRLRSMIDNLQAQRENLANEVINARAETAMVNAKLASEIQVSRSLQAAAAEARNKAHTAEHRIEELELALKTQSEQAEAIQAQLREEGMTIQNQLQEELTALRAIVAGQTNDSTFAEVPDGSSTVSIPALSTSQLADLAPASLAALNLDQNETIKTSAYS